MCVLRRVVQAAPLVCRAGVSAEAQSREEGKEGEEEEGARRRGRSGPDCCDFCQSNLENTIFSFRIIKYDSLDVFNR